MLECLRCKCRATYHTPPLTTLAPSPIPPLPVKRTEPNPPPTTSFSGWARRTPVAVQPFSRSFTKPKLCATGATRRLSMTNALDPMHTKLASNLGSVPNAEAASSPILCLYSTVHAPDAVAWRQFHRFGLEPGARQANRHGHNRRRRSFSEIGPERPIRAVL